MLNQTLRSRAKRRLLFTLVLFLTLMLFLWLSLISGAHGISFSDTPKLFFDTSKFSTIVQNIRLPRALAACIVGALLGLSGVLMQGVLQNPLASPFTLGVSQAAALGATSAIILIDASSLASLQLLGSFTIPLFAFSASMVCSLIIVWLGKHVAMSPTALILAGVGLGSLFHSATMFMQYFTTEINAAATLFWTFGELSRATYNTLIILSIVALISSIYAWRLHWKLDALSFGDDSAKNKGIDTKSLRVSMLIVASLCAALAVSFFGIIGFIGLVAPHIVRLVIGSSHSFLIPLSMLCGATLLLAADYFARVALYPSTLPVGILTSFIGVPMLLYLLIKKERS